MILESISHLKKLSPSAFARTEQERSLAQFAEVRKITQLDIAIAFVILADFVFTSVDSVTKWWYVGIIDLILTGMLVLLFFVLPIFRPLLGRLMLVGLVAGVCELFTDASGQYVVHSLIYPAGELTIWTSPLYMPLSWLVTLTYLGYISWRLRALLGWKVAILLCGLLGAVDIPLFEEISYYGGWWRYVPTRLMFGHTPVYVALFEGLVVATLPLLFDRLERRSWLETLALGVIVGIWMAISALTAWLILGY
jgi:hypothetical protein